MSLNAQQQYKSCLDDGIVRWSFLDYHIADAGWVSSELVAYGDTLLNDYVYKKMYHVADFNESDVSKDNKKWKKFQPDLSNSRLMSTYIRESEDASKMYIYDVVQKTEYLMSDMNLQKGDTLFGYLDKDSTRYGVVNSVYVRKGLKHIHLHFNFYNSLTFIESIGPDVWGWPIHPYPDGIVNCFQNQSVFYKNEGTIESLLPISECPCGYYQGAYGIKEVITNNFTIAIKREQIEIFFLENESVRISLFDLTGRWWHSRQLSSDEYVIETVSFPKGVYLLEIFYVDKNKVSTNKIITN